MGAEKHCTRSSSPQGTSTKRTYETQGKEALSVVRQNGTSRRRADDMDGVKGLWFCSVVIRSLQKPAKTRLEPYRNGEDFRFEARVAQLTRLRQEMPL
jgi:hypothetical protein